LRKDGNTAVPVDNRSRIKLYWEKNNSLKAGGRGGELAKKLSPAPVVV